MSIGKQVGAASLQQPGADCKLFISHCRAAMRLVYATVPLRSLRANCRAGLRMWRTGASQHLKLRDRDPVI